MSIKKIFNLLVFSLPVFCFAQKAKPFYTLPIEIIGTNIDQTECLSIKEAITDEPLKYDKNVLSDYFVFGNYRSYANTFIATKEFEDRYQSYCNSKLLKLYLDNVNKNLWEVDQLVVNMLKKTLTADSLYFSTSTDIVPEYVDQYLNHYNSIIKTFENFVSQKLTQPIVIDYAAFNWRNSRELTKEYKKYEIPSTDANEMLIFLDSRLIKK